MENKSYIVVGKTNFYLGLIVGFLMMIAGGYYILNINQTIGAFILGMGFAACILLLEQRINSIGGRN